MNIYQERISLRINQPVVRLLLNVTPSYKQKMLNLALNKRLRKPTLFNKFPVPRIIKNKERKVVTKSKINVYGKSLPKLFNKHVDYGNIMPERRHSLKMILDKFSNNGGDSI